MPHPDYAGWKVRVVLKDGRTWTDTWGSDCEDEETAVSGISYMYQEGNYSCDCNKTLFMSRNGLDVSKDNQECGDTLELAELFAIRPDGTEISIEVWRG